MHALTKLRIVWMNACVYHILNQGSPFPNIPLDSFSVQQLEHHVCHAGRLAAQWHSLDWVPWRCSLINAATDTSITDIRLMPGSEGTIVFALSKTIWSAISIWQLEPTTSKTPGRECSSRKLGEWSPKGAIFDGFALNSSPSAEAKVAVSVFNDGFVHIYTYFARFRWLKSPRTRKHTVELLSLEASTDWSLRTLMSFPFLSFPSTFKPITLEGDLLAMSDDNNETIIFNWRTRAYATLQHNRNEEHNMWHVSRLVLLYGCLTDVLQHNKCIQIVFAYQSILVVRAHSIYLFPFPILKLQEEAPLQYAPIAQHSFGWVDSVCVRIMNQNHISGNDLHSHALSILVRAETDNPWSSIEPAIMLYALLPNPDYTSSDPLPPPTSSTGSVSGMTSSSSSSSPYIFPPIFEYKVASSMRSGALLCSNMILGRLGTAFWIQPRDGSVFGLYWSGDGTPNYLRSRHNPNESLFVTVFPGSLKSKPNPFYHMSDLSELQGMAAWHNDDVDWSSMDYDEDVGRIVLGSRLGEITVLDM